MRLILSFLFFFHCFQVNCQFEVILSSRTFHPNSEIDTLNTLKIIEEFEVSQVDWMYCESKKKLELLREKGIPYSLAINPMLPDSLEYGTPKNKVLDINGNPIIVPWMKNWSRKNLYWGCVNNESFYNLFIAKCKKLADLKCYGIFVDDAKMNYQFAKDNGCFCNECINKFTHFLVQKKIGNNDFNYKEYLLNSKRDKVLDGKYYSEFVNFQKKSVIDFHNKWMKEMKNYTKNSIKFLTNNYGGNWDEIYSLFDIGIAEINEKKSSLIVIDKIKENLEKNSKEQFLAFASNINTDNYKFILHSYFNKLICILPWDHVLNESFGNSEIQKYYAKKQEIKPMLDFLKNSILTECSSSKLNEHLKNFKIKKDVKFKKLFEDSNYYYLSIYNDLRDNDEIKLKKVNNKIVYYPILSEILKTNSKNKKKISGTVIILKSPK